MKKIGMLTIGQSPREDILPSLRDILGDGVEIIEAGALDGKTLKDIKKIPLNLEDYILVTRMRDGKEIKITKKYILPLMQEKLDWIESQEVRITAVMCTGKFPKFRSKGIVVTPMEILKGVLEGCLKEGRLGVVYPTEEQIANGVKEWSRPGVTVYGDTVSPYEPKDVNGLCERLAEQNLDLILLNCFGFPTELRRRVTDRTGKPVIQANTMIAHVFAEMLN